MPKKSTPTKPKNPRKIAPKPECWPPYAPDDIGRRWALEAIRHGNAAILARYLWQVDEIDSAVRRELAEMLNPTSNHTWRLDARQRFRGKPAKLAKRWKSLFNETIVNLTKLLSGVDPLDPRCPRTLSDMLDPDSKHELQLDFKQRKSGRPPLGPGRTDWLSPVPSLQEINRTRLAALRVADRIREAQKSGRKIPLKQLLHRSGISRASWYRYCKELFPKQNKRPIGLKARSLK
jgi:predicted DNA-binding transcriptional regulator AlpA